ncbi:DUF4221 family protein [Belliella kenyensis]|uniref:DUF4221 family protein n=1 Tax=Belliella kenyensis TaxID=1472724 RepID=A0ABV8EI73_9BACT|nr:DUF4221 family protein [Belliella kenyensis]MCH7401375.1 DUF4221 domain-containing protein [Belliella kenyensis]MDN3602818.1 DUF4221 family protein [Belliella kenyensis]
MKNLLIVIAFIFLISCKEKKSGIYGNTYDEIQITMDTVVIDSKDKITMAVTSFPNFPQNSDQNKLYFWHGRTASLEIIDLDKLELIEKREFEKEGPNGVGQNANQGFILGDHSLALIDWEQVTLVDLEGNVQERINLNDDWIKDGLDDNESLAILGFSEDGDLMFCSIKTFSRLNSNIVKVDLKNKTTQLLELSAYDKRENLRITHKIERNGSTSMLTISPSLEFEKSHHKVIFWSDAFNSIYVYDPMTDSLNFKTITSTLTPNEKIGNFKNDVTSDESMQEEIQKYFLEMTFSKLLRDDKNKVYYRFSSYNLPQVAEESLKGRVFFNILNEAFEVIGEKEVSDLFKTVPTAQFVKDGLIYCFLNVNDELGYMRMTIN